MKKLALTGLLTTLATGCSVHYGHYETVAPSNEPVTLFNPTLYTTTQDYETLSQKKPSAGDVVAVTETKNVVITGYDATGKRLACNEVASPKLNTEFELNANQVETEVKYASSVGNVIRTADDIVKDAKAEYALKKSVTGINCNAN